MAVYILFFIFIAILAVEYELKVFEKKNWLIILILLLSLFVGFRGPDVSKDYFAYHAIFDNIFELSDWDGYLPIFEPGFSLIVKLCRYIFPLNYTVAIMLIFGLLSVSLKTFSINKLGKNPFLVLLFYYSQYFFLHEMTQVRIGFASAIFFIGLIFYFKGQKLIYFFLVLLAACFHYSAILYLLIFIIDTKYFNRIFFSIMVGMALLLGIMKIPLLSFLGNLNPAEYSGKLNNYAELVEYGLAEPINVFNVMNLINLSCCLYFIWGVKKSKLYSNYQLVLFLKFFIVSIFLLSLLSGIPSLSFRFSELFGVVSMFVFASLPIYLPFKKLNILIPIFIAAIFFYITLFHGDLIQPYRIVKFK